MLDNDMTGPPALCVSHFDITHSNQTNSRDLNTSILSLALSKPYHYT